MIPSKVEWVLPPHLIYLLPAPYRINSLEKKEYLLFPLAPLSGQMWSELCATHQQPDSQGITSCLRHCQVTRVRALPVLVETEARLQAGDISSHSEVNGCDKETHMNHLETTKHLFEKKRHFKFHTSFRHKGTELHQEKTIFFVRKHK